MPFTIDPRLAWQLVGGEGVVIDVPDRKAFGFNPVGSRIWSLLGEHDEEAIAQTLTREFDVDMETARADVQGFILTLREKRFLAP